MVVIEVSDTGPGVSERARAHLFEAFQGSTRPGGSGLGLAIAAELVRAHGGEIRLVDGTIGATFRIIIPDRAVDIGGAARRAGAGLRASPAGGVLPPPHSPSKTGVNALSLGEGWGGGKIAKTSRKNPLPALRADLPRKRGRCCGAACSRPNPREFHPSRRACQPEGDPIAMHPLGPGAH